MGFMINPELHFHCYPERNEMESKDPVAESIASITKPDASSIHATFSVAAPLATATGLIYSLPLASPSGFVPVVPCPRTPFFNFVALRSG